MRLSSPTNSILPASRSDGRSIIAAPPCAESAESPTRKHEANTDAKSAPITIRRSVGDSDDLPPNTAEAPPTREPNEEAAVGDVGDVGDVSPIDSGGGDAYDEGEVDEADEPDVRYLELFAEYESQGLA
jgi:hypothetical protein